MKGPARALDGLLAAALLGTVGLLACAAPEVHGAPPAGKTSNAHRDAATERDAQRDGDLRPPAPAAAAPRPAPYGAEWIGLTQTELEARRGSPTRRQRGRWVYAGDQSGCREFVVDEVFTFKNGRVANLTLDRRRTTKHCGVNPAFR